MWRRIGAAAGRRAPRATRRRRTENSTVSRHVPSARRMCRRSTPSRVAPSLAIAACDRVLSRSVCSLTRPKPQSSNAWPSSASLQAGLTDVPHQGGPYAVQPRCTRLVVEVPLGQAAGADDGARRARGPESAASRTTYACRGPVRPTPACASAARAAVDVGPAAARAAAVAGRPDPLVVQRGEQRLPRRRCVAGASADHVVGQALDRRDGRAGHAPNAQRMPRAWKAPVTAAAAPGRTSSAAVLTVVVAAAAKLVSAVNANCASMMIRLATGVTESGADVPQRPRPDLAVGVHLALDVGDRLVAVDPAQAVRHASEV